MKFIVHTIETTTVRRSKTFIANSAFEAEVMAEEEDWREWEKEEQDAMSCGIDYVESAEE